MQAATTTANPPSTATATRPVATGQSAPASAAFAGYQIIRRNGAVVSFAPDKISVALM